LADQFIADAAEQVQQAAAILLLTPATKESLPALLTTLLELLPENSFFKKTCSLVRDRRFAGACRYSGARASAQSTSSWQYEHCCQSAYRHGKLDQHRQRSAEALPRR
jgi:hypothetical protein